VRSVNGPLASVSFHGLLLEVCTIICLGVYRHLVSGHHEISRLQHCLECIMLVTLA